VQRLRGAADLRRNRHDRLPARRVLTLVVENQPHRALAHFRGKRVRRLAHDAPSYSGVGASGKPGAVHLLHIIRLREYTEGQDEYRKLGIDYLKIVVTAFIDKNDVITELHLPPSTPSRKLVMKLSR